LSISRTKNYELIAKLNKPVHDLHFSLYPKYFNEYNYEEIKDAFKKLMTNEKSIFLLLEDEEVAIGYSWIEFREYPENAFKKRYKSLYVHQLSIVEDKRNKGYGSKLMDYINKLAQEASIEMIELDYWVENTSAKEFYKKHEFNIYREFVYKQT
jgi:ribosomal protein S18 acetylase RimI-like enzyme